MKCSSCGVKFQGSLAEEHVSGSEDCLEWFREAQFERNRD